MFLSVFSSKFLNPKKPYATDPAMISPYQMKTFEKHFRQDIAIYDHFNKTFWQKVENFGHDRMKLEKRKIEDVFKKCNLDPDFCNFEITPRVTRRFDFFTITS